MSFIECVWARGSTRVCVRLWVLCVYVCVCARSRVCVCGCVCFVCAAMRVGRCWGHTRCYLACVLEAEPAQIVAARFTSVHKGIFHLSHPAPIAPRSAVGLLKLVALGALGARVVLPEAASTGSGVCGLILPRVNRVFRLFI
jgi:hypothetical protein